MIATPVYAFPIAKYDNPNGGTLAAGTSYGNLSTLIGQFNAGDLKDGTYLGVKAFGRFTTPAAAGATAFALRLAGVSISIFQTQNITPSNSITNGTWFVNIEGQIRLTASNSCNFMGAAVVSGLTGPTALTLAPTTAPAIGTAFDPTGALGGAFLGMISTAATAGQSFQCHHAQLIWVP